MTSSAASPFIVRRRAVLSRHRLRHDLFHLVQHAVCTLSEGGHQHRQGQSIGVGGEVVIHLLAIIDAIALLGREFTPRPAELERARQTKADSAGLFLCPRLTRPSSRAIVAPLPWPRCEFCRHDPCEKEYGRLGDPYATAWNDRDHRWIFLCAIDDASTHSTVPQRLLCVA